MSSSITGRCDVFTALITALNQIMRDYSMNQTFFGRIRLLLGMYGDQVPLYVDDIRSLVRQAPPVEQVRNPMASTRTCLVSV